MPKFCWVSQFQAQNIHPLLIAESKLYVLFYVDCNLLSTFKACKFWCSENVYVEQI